MPLTSQPDLPEVSRAARPHLLVIDAQNDFCDIPGASLPVPGADADMHRLAAFIRRHLPDIGRITLTLDSHYRIDIAHPGFWRTAEGTAVPPFTAIGLQDVREGRFLPRDVQALPQVQAYLAALESRGRYTHMVWPVHCELGTWGHNLHAEVAAACGAWEDLHGLQADKVLKGLNPWTEHYSAIEAEVPLPGDASTQTNRALLDSLAGSGPVIVAGEAGSHCVKATLEHLVRELPASRLVLLTDAISPVPGFETQQSQIFDALAAQGALRVRTDEWRLDDLGSVPAT